MDNCMGYDLRQILQDELRYIDAELKIISQTTSERIPGCLAYANTKGKTEYEHRSVHRKNQKRSSVRLGDDKHPKVIQIKQNAYDIALRSNLTKDHRMIRNFLNHYNGSRPEDVERHLKPIYIDRTGLVDKNRLFTQQLNWGKQNCDSQENTDNPNLHIASDGTKIRSKSELIIYDLLKNKYQVPMHHEQKIRLINHETGMKETRLPDFVFLLENGNIGILEHCGMLHDPEYFKRVVRTLKLYIDNNFTLNENLFYTVDDADGKLNLVYVEQYIRGVILPKVNSRKWKPL